MTDTTEDVIDIVDRLRVNERSLTKQIDDLKFKLNMYKSIRKDVRRHLKRLQKGCDGESAIGSDNVR